MSFSAGALPCAAPVRDGLPDEGRPSASTGGEGGQKRSISRAAAASVRACAMPAFLPFCRCCSGGLHRRRRKVR